MMMSDFDRIRRIVARLDAAPDGSPVQRMIVNPLPDICECPENDDVHRIHHALGDLWWLLEKVASAAT